MNEPNNAHEFRPPNLPVPENVRQLSCGMQPLQTNRPLVPVKLNRNLFRYVHSTPMSERSKGGASRAKGHENEMEQIKLQELRSRLPKNFRSSFVNIDHMDYESLQRIVDLASTLSLDEDNDEDETKYSSVRDASLKHDALTSPVTNWLPDPYVAPCDSLDDPFLVIDENLNRSICDLDEKHARQSIEELWNKEHHVVAVALQQDAMARKAQRRVRKRIEKLKRLEKEYQCRAFWDTIEQQDAHREAQEARRAAEKQLSAEKIRITRELRRTLTTPRDQINAQYSFSGAI